jgi:hypothetical protein
MIYNVQIALNGAKKRRVGDVIAVLEKEGLEFIGFQKKTTNPSCKEYPGIEQQIRENQFVGTKAMEFYQKKFSPGVLATKMHLFRKNYVKLSFESGKQRFDTDELWNAISENVFRDKRKIPIMFVLNEGSDNIVVDDSAIAATESIVVETLIPTRETDIPIQ